MCPIGTSIGQVNKFKWIGAQHTQPDTITDVSKIMLQLILCMSIGAPQCVHGNFLVTFLQWQCQENSLITKRSCETILEMIQWMCQTDIGFCTLHDHKIKWVWYSACPSTTLLWFYSTCSPIKPYAVTSLCKYDTRPTCFCSISFWYIVYVVNLRIWAFET